MTLTNLQEMIKKENALIECEKCRNYKDNKSVKILNNHIYCLKCVKTF